jgi:hypothetical protein
MYVCVYEGWLDGRKEGRTNGIMDERKIEEKRWCWERFAPLFGADKGKILKIASSIPRSFL